jgi:hypothetical protein
VDGSTPDVRRSFGVVGLLTVGELPPSGSEDER